MIRTVEITNYKNEVLNIDLFNSNSSGLNIRNITGLGPVKADITTTKLVVSDGDYYNSARANGRNIVITLGFNIAAHLGINSIEDCRQMVYKYFPLKKKVKVRIVTDNRSLYSYGYVESDEPDIFSNDETTQISIICPESWLRTDDTYETPLNNIRSLFKFPFEVLEEDLPPKDIYGIEKIDGMEVVKEYQDIITFYGNEQCGFYDNKSMYLDIRSVKYNVLVENDYDNILRSNFKL